MDLIDLGIYALFALFGVAILGLILMELFNLIKDPKSLIRAGMVIVGFAILFFISYSVSVGDVKTKYIAAGVSETYSRMIGAGLIFFYVFLIVSFIGIVASEVYKLLK